MVCSTLSPIKSKSGVKKNKINTTLSAHITLYARYSPYPHITDEGDIDRLASCPRFHN